MLILDFIKFVLNLFARFSLLSDLFFQVVNLSELLASNEFGLIAFFRTTIKFILNRAQLVLD